MDYREIVTHFKNAIMAGDIAVGSRLPTVRDIENDPTFDTSHATAARAMRTLGMEGYALALPGSGGTVAVMPGDSIVLRVPVTGARGTAHTPGGQVDVLEVDVLENAELPKVIKQAFELGDTEKAIARYTSLTRDGKVMRAAISWCPGAFSALIPELLERENVWLIDRVKETTGRVPTVEIQRFFARSATAVEARVLGVSEGVALQVRETKWLDEQGMIELSEAVYPPGVSIAVEFTDSDTRRNPSE